VKAILIVIVHILAKKSSQMSLIQRDDTVQHLSTATSNPAFRNSVLPTCLDACALWLQTPCVEQLDDIDIEFGVVVEDDVPVWTRFGKRFPQLLRNQFPGRTFPLWTSAFSRRTSIRRLNANTTW
jgi:hypothetical protein